MKAQEISERISRYVLIALVIILFLSQSSWAQLEHTKQPPPVISLQLPLKGEWQPKQHFNVWVGLPVCGRHLGEDIPREKETPVYPIGIGTVRFAKYGPEQTPPIGGIGYGVIIEHNLNGEYICSVYFHMREPKDNETLTEGEDILTIDQPLGYISGKAIDHNYTYPHLHSGIRREKYISPYRPDGHDTRTNRWYYPGYTTIYDEEGKKECKPDNPYHEQIANKWFKPCDFFSQYLEPSQKFDPGDYIQTTAKLNVRNSPEIRDDNVLPISPIPQGSKGKMIDDERTGVFADGYYWWYVHFDGYDDGWCAENWLEKLEDAKPQDIRLIRRFGIGEVRSVDWSPDKVLIVIGTRSGLHILDSQTLETLKFAEEHKFGFESVAFSPDGFLIASGSRDYTIKLWRVSDGECVATLNHEDSVASVAFSPDGSLLASGGWDRTIKLWKVSDRECVAILEGHLYSVRSVAFSPDGNLVASGSLDNTIKLWRVSDGKCTATLEGHTDNVYSVAFNPDGTLLASGGGDETIRLWRVSDGKCIAILGGHKDRVYSVAFSPDGSLLASGSRDNTIKLWRVSDGKCMTTLNHEGYVNSVAFSPDSSLLVSGSMDNTIGLWKIGAPKEDKERPNIGCAVIVAGKGGSWISHAWDWIIDIKADKVYRRLRGLGFDDEHIFYLNKVDKPRDADGDGDNDVDGNATSAGFKEAITEWTPKRTGLSGQSVLYMAGHGGETGSFDTNDGFILGETLKEWLERSPKETEMLIVIDSCYAGAFIENPKYPRNSISSKDYPYRVILTATLPSKHLSYTDWFGTRVFKHLQEGNNVLQAFIEASSITLGEPLLDDNGDAKGSSAEILKENPPDMTDKEGWVSANMKIGKPSAIIPEYLSYATLCSAGELRIIDPESRITGLVSGNVKEEIPNSVYIEDAKTVVVASRVETCRYVVVGTNTGIYGLTIGEEGGTVFKAIDITTSIGTIHQYTIDRDVLSEGEKGVTVQIDTDGDGVFEQTISTDSELTKDEHLSVTDVTPKDKYPTTWGNVKQTKLYQNYPNPSNPDTWIPYQLAEDVNVIIRIYNISGRLVRTLNLGHKHAGFYTTKDKAAYWNGRNEVGEQVASGIYFYTIQAGEFTATRKMLMLK